MNTEILARLNRINQEFYQNFADSFSQTRRRVQPGVSRILDSLPKDGNYLDIGCGNGNLVRHWIRRGFNGFFCGVDFSPGLIATAKGSVETDGAKQTTCFLQADLSKEDWMSELPKEEWDGIFCFAVLHHIPGASKRVRLCRQVRTLLGDSRSMWVSVWQPLNSVRLSKRIYDWENVQISPEALEEGDVLMDWRAQKEKTNQTAYRYVHIFDDGELATLADSSGYFVKEKYFSDGKEGNLGLYQHWVANY